MLNSLKIQTFRQGEQIIEYNTVGELFYVILQGKVDITTPNPTIKRYKYHYKEYQNLKKWKETIFEDEFQKFYISKVENKNKTSEIRKKFQKEFDHYLLKIIHEYMAKEQKAHEVGAKQKEGHDCHLPTKQISVVTKILEERKELDTPDSKSSYKAMSRLQSIIFDPTALMQTVRQKQSQNFINCSYSLRRDFKALTDETLDKLIKLESYQGFDWFIQVSTL